MSLDSFQDFIKKNIVKRQTPNKERALSLIKEAEEKKRFLDITLQKIPSEEMNANYIVDSCYDILMELTRAKMFMQGYNSSSSHEAEVSFLRVLGFAECKFNNVDTFVGIIFTFLLMVDFRPHLWSFFRKSILNTRTFMYYLM